MLGQFSSTLFSQWNVLFIGKKKKNYSKPHNDIWETRQLGLAFPGHWILTKIWPLGFLFSSLFFVLLNKILNLLIFFCSFLIAFVLLVLFVYIWQVYHHFNLFLFSSRIFFYSRICLLKKCQVFKNFFLRCSKKFKIWFYNLILFWICRTIFVFFSTVHFLR